MAVRKAGARVPISREQLEKELEKLGVREGQIIEVHADLSAFDFVIGGARTVVDALLETAGRNGTILMASETQDNSEPSEWDNGMAEPYMYKDIRDAIPPYDSRTSDLSDKGGITENFRHRAGVVTTSHPQVSYAAWGRYAKLLCNHQSLNYPLAEESPAARIYELKGYALLMGCDFDSLTSLHLAEYRTDDRPIRIAGACVSTAGGPQWRSYLDLHLNSHDFLNVQNSMTKKNMIRQAVINGCRCMFFPIAPAIDEATRWLENNSIYELYR
jgi:aminoglycoside 3-N-acetyltransferase